MKIKFTKREMEILFLISQEKTMEEIASDLFISLSTVEKHRKNMRHKLGAKNTAGLIVKAFELNFLKIDTQGRLVAPSLKMGSGKGGFLC